MRNKILVIIFILTSTLIFCESQKITVSAIGDIMAHDNLQEYALSNEKGYEVFFESTKQIFFSSDLTIANFETPVSDDIPISGYPAFNAKTSLVDAIKNSGINVVSLANNHAFDQGEQGIVSTLQAVKEKGLFFSGTGLTPEESKTPVIFTVNGITIGYISLTFSINGLKLVEKADKPYINLVPLENEKRVTEYCNIVKNTKNIVDVMIVSYHSGEEYASVPSQIQDRVYKRLADSGADIILGHHPHVLQKVAFYETPDGRKSLIAYSLGNFISAQARYLPKLNDENRWIYDSILSKTAEGFILQFDIVKWEDKIMVLNPRMLPFFNLCFVQKKNNKNYAGFELAFMEDILKMDESSDSRFSKKIKDIKKLVSYRFEKIKKLVLIPVKSPYQ